jgi:hypothetical protein
VRLVCGADNLSMSRFSRQCGILNISQPYRPPRSVTEITLLLLFLRLYENRILGEVFGCKSE